MWAREGLVSPGLMWKSLKGGGGRGVRAKWRQGDALLTP